ncbi:branched-chain amino acid ABC transporter substrate-binding protein [Hydrogenophaga sp. 5NK40-0174]|uniref:branched-chain amino acid ABC transporter substrate-binding protein n=1 Tax=Hydrogenophaga sp. 5NK40-0174 TaxID=3127649 RepID=UPI00334222B4
MTLLRPVRRRLFAAIAASISAAALANASWAAEDPKPEPIRLAMIEGLSGPFANTGKAVFRNLVWAAERVNARGGVKLPDGARPLQIDRFDSKGKTEEAIAALQSAVDQGARIIMQGNSSATAAGLIETIERHNQRMPEKQLVFLNYSAVDPSLTNERCSFWHFRFDAHADMRMTALMSVLAKDKDLKKVYLIGQDYSFGRSVVKEAMRQLAEKRPDIEVVGEELHPMARIKDFAPYAAKIRASGAQAVITGNWGNDLTLLVKAAKESGFDGSFYTFYGNALGAPAAMGSAGIGKVVAVADWFPNQPQAESRTFYESFRQRFPDPADDYVHMRMNLMIEALAKAIEKAGKVDAKAIAYALEDSSTSLAGQTATVRAADHQVQQPLAVAVMERQGAEGTLFDVEGSGYGFKVVRQLTAEQAAMPHTCNMVRP